MKPIRVLSRFRLPLLWGIALLAGLAGTLGAQRYLDARVGEERHRLQQRGRSAFVVVAKRDLPAGARVDPETMATRKVPAMYLPPGVVDPSDFDPLIGRRLREPMRAGEPLFSGIVMRARTEAFSTRLHHGVRAMTIAVDEVNGISGMLLPGDRIDLMLSARVQGVDTREVERTAVLMQNVLVLATGRHVDAPEAGRRIERYQSITVEVSPEQAQRLIVAQRSGRVTALLRHPTDRARTSARGLDLEALLGITRSHARRDKGLELIVGGRGVLQVSSVDRPGPGRGKNGRPGAASGLAPSGSANGDRR
ncbi:MAG: Flp pilus assembly protein CpaB [Burkholderiaceae bacterium]|nr:Flp pilus assembly protein CpaB [Burkholderiaceae bacterium]